MTIWNFRIWLLGADPDKLLEWSDALFDAGCDDSTPGTFEGTGHVDFHRESESLNKAIASAMSDVQQAGLTVDRIEVTKDDVAAWA